MYSRNRMPASEERYQRNLPPVYSGNRFRSMRQESVPAADMRPSPPVPLPAEIPVQDTPPPEEEKLPAAEDIAESERFFDSEKGTAGLLSGIGQEELILIALLLLLCAEHERCMDIIVILLLLLGIQ